MNSFSKGFKLLNVDGISYVGGYDFTDSVLENRSTSQLQFVPGILGAFCIDAPYIENNTWNTYTECESYIHGNRVYVLNHKEGQLLMDFDERPEDQTLQISRVSVKEFINDYPFVEQLHAHLVNNFP